MNYANYEDAIVQGRKVRIIGWPTSVTFASPSTIGNLKDMCTLHDGLLTGSIRWVRMSSADVKAHAEDLQERQDEGEIIGKKRKRWSAKEKNKTIKHCNDDPRVRNNDAETPLAPKSAKRARGTQRAKCTPKLQMPSMSKAMISDSEEEEEEEGNGVARDANVAGRG